MNLPVQAQPVQRAILTTSGLDREYNVHDTCVRSNGVVASGQGVTAIDWKDLLNNVNTAFRPVTPFF
jgi:hypothetical protein